MKKLIKIIVGVFIVVALLFVALELSLNKLVLAGVNAAAPDALGVPVTLQGADISLVRGQAALQGLHVGNPKGYKTSGLLDLGAVSVDVDNSTLFSDVIVIKEIAIDGLVLTYEKGLFKSNLGALIESLSAAEKTGAEKPEKEKSSKKVVIEKLVITGIRMHVSVTGAMGAAIPIPLPAITLTDIGKEKEGVTFIEAVRRILGAIAQAAGSAIAGSAKLLGQGVGAVGDGAWAVGEGTVHAGKAVVGGVGNALDAVNPFGKE